VGGYLNIAPERTEGGPLSKMMKLGIATYDRFKSMFDKYSEEVGKNQFLMGQLLTQHTGLPPRAKRSLAVGNHSPSRFGVKTC
jgi:radical SAM superfamily enzyme YgiQ (UPF0313 family)